MSNYLDRLAWSEACERNDRRVAEDELDTVMKNRDKVCGKAIKIGKRAGYCTAPKNHKGYCPMDNE